MKLEKCIIQGIPAIIWGEPSKKAYLFVHGKMSSKDAAAVFAQLAQEKGYQTLSFDLPQHGDRAEEPERCHIWSGTRDVKKLCDAAFARWEQVSLFGCSLGAYFSLHVCGDYPFRNCLFQSPIVDMEYLIRQMMVWFGVTQERLEREREVETPIDTMSWDYYQYVLAHPITRWDIPTAILYGGKDNLQSRQVMKGFADRFGCRLTVSEFSEHPFMQPLDSLIVEDWMRRSLEWGSNPGRATTACCIQQQK